ncbi:DUF262 domain-containing protein [Lysobacter terrae]
MTFSISELRDRTVWQIYRMRERIQLNPDYQRSGNIWAPDNRQLLLDTILNKFDVPKIYFHKFTKPLVKGGKAYELAIVDGKQRLETLWSFIDGKIALADDFTLFRDDKVAAGGMTYSELGLEYPDLKADFDGFLLSVILIETDDVEMIEEMFSRLNEAAPLTAPEKRNAYGGPIPVAVRKLAKAKFFEAKLPFENQRYRHYDLAAKFLLAEHEGKVVDTKKVRLDDFVEHFSDESRTRMPAFVKQAQQNIERMASVFSDKDSLLRQVGMVMLYYHVFRIANRHGWTGEITRKKLLDFERRRADNRLLMESGDKRVDLDLIEFDRYAQSPNDGGAIKFRLQIILKKVFQREVEADEL